MLFAGGGISSGQVIGATDPRGEDPIERRVGPGDFVVATIDRHLGVDCRRVVLKILAGRPVAVIGESAPIPEIARHGS